MLRDSGCFCVFDAFEEAETQGDDDTMTIFDAVEKYPPALAERVSGFCN